jgi:hypothetical protein
MLVALRMFIASSDSCLEHCVSSLRLQTGSRVGALLPQIDVARGPVHRGVDRVVFQRVRGRGVAGVVLQDRVPKVLILHRAGRVA